MTEVKENWTIQDLLNTLNSIKDKSKRIIISSDEEGNTLFKGFYVDEYPKEIIIAGLSGTEVN